MGASPHKYREDFDSNTEFIAQVPDERLDHDCSEDCGHWSHWYGVARRAKENS